MNFFCTADPLDFNSENYLHIHVVRCPLSGSVIFLNISFCQNRDNNAPKSSYIFLN